MAMFTGMHAALKLATFLSAENIEIFPGVGKIEHYSTWVSRERERER